MKPSIPYQFHDSLIFAAEFGPRRELSLMIELQPAGIAKPRTVVLRFGGIHNVEAVLSVVNDLQKRFAERQGGAWSIDRFDYDGSRASTADDLYLLLEIDHLEPLQIHCMKMSAIESPDG